VDIKEIKRRLTDLRDERSFAAAIETDKGALGEYLKGSYEAYRLAVDMLEHLKPEKVTIPQFVADWIENDLDYVGKEPVNIVHGVVEDGDWGPRGEGLDDMENQKLFAKAMAKG